LVFVWLIVCMGAILALAFLHLRRVGGEPAARWWTWAWLAFCAGVLLTPPEDPATELVSHGLGTLFPALLLAGALAFLGRSVPRWLAPAAAALGIARGGLALAGATAPLAAITLATEPVLDGIAALLLLREARRAEGGVVLSTLGAAHLGIGAMEAWAGALIHLDVSATAQPLFLAVGASCALILALAQLMALGDRGRAREAEAIRRRARDLELLRRVAEAGAGHDALRPFLDQAFAALRALLPADGAGIWLLTPDRSATECVAHFGLGDELPAQLVRAPLDRPMIARSLQVEEPIYLDLARDPRLMALTREYAARLGLGECGFAPLRWNGRLTGFLVAALRAPRRFEAQDRLLLVSVARQLALALARVRAAEERALEAERLRQAQKIETLGTLAGGVAHDFNNQLAVILGNVELLRRGLTAHPELCEALHDIEVSGRHCAELTRALLAFARMAPTAFRVVSVQSEVRELEAMLRPLIPSSIELCASVEDGVQSVIADPAQLRQALVNLAVNAAQAIPETGQIELRVRNREIAEAEPLPHPHARPGRYVEFAVRDDGAGIPPEIRERIFDPFFTTKEPGEGTGLGLAIAWGTARSHGGWIEVDSQVGAGSEFRMLLPASERPAEPARAAPSSSAERAPGTVLVADDEAGVRRLVARVLSGLGHRVIEARDGDEALARFEEGAEAIDVVILDQTMPGRSGPAVLSAMRQRRPSLPAILTSGYALEDDVRTHEAAFLSKPFSPDELAGLVGELLKPPAPAS
jgi:signal transduction histidine kinase/CheY-like chemotaxis protein